MRSIQQWWSHFNGSKFTVTPSCCTVYKNHLLLTTIYWWVGQLSFCGNMWTTVLLWLLDLCCDKSAAFLCYKIDVTSWCPRSLHDISLHLLVTKGTCIDLCVLRIHLAWNLAGNLFHAIFPTSFYDITAIYHCQ